MVILTIKDFGQIKLEMNYSEAKNTASNFVELCRKGFYNNYENWVEMALDTWHRNWNTKEDMDKDLNNAQE